MPFYAYNFGNIESELRQFEALMVSFVQENLPNFLLQTQQTLLFQFLNPNQQKK